MFLLHGTKLCCLALCHDDEPRHLFTYFDVIRDNNEDFFLKTYLRFFMMLECVNSVMILHKHNINFLREMSVNLIKITFI